MLRTLAIAAAAMITLGTASLTPTTASAHGWRHHHPHHHHHSRWHRHWHGPRVVYRAPVYYGSYSGCWRKRWVPTPWGPQLRTVNICRY